MRLKKLVLLGSLVLGLVPLCRGQQITGSHHDFTTSSKSSYNSTGEVCIVCHAPHGTDAVAVPLWNHHTTTQSFTTYSGYKFVNYTGSVAPDPDGASKLCLSCHDGAPLTIGVHASMLGTDLSNDHPISFVYNTALSLATSGGVKDPAVATTSLGGTIATDLLDKDGKVQCPSCHEVHDQTIYRFGKISNAGSALCLTCHNK